MAVAAPRPAASRWQPARARASASWRASPRTAGAWTGGSHATTRAGCMLSRRNKLPPLSNAASLIRVYPYERCGDRKGPYRPSTNRARAARPVPPCLNRFTQSSESLDVAVITAIDGKLIDDGNAILIVHTREYSAHLAGWQYKPRLLPGLREYSQSRGLPT